MSLVFFCHRTLQKARWPEGCTVFRLVVLQTSVWGRSFCSELDSISRSIRTDGEQQEPSLENRPNGHEPQRRPPSICNINEGGGERPLSSLQKFPLLCVNVHFVLEEALEFNYSLKMLALKREGGPWSPRWANNSLLIRRSHWSVSCRSAWLLGNSPCTSCTSTNVLFLCRKRTFPKIRVILF